MLFSAYLFPLDKTVFKLLNSIVIFLFFSKRLSWQRHPGGFALPILLYVPRQSQLRLLGANRGYFLFYTISLCVRLANYKFSYHLFTPNFRLEYLDNLSKLIGEKALGK
ncbi:MAG TPA: hypothetical protein ENI27_10875 [bacterium]|nr:hypothetical protein [bacterium]